MKILWKELKIWKIVSKIYFDKIYNKYTNIPNGWKVRSDLEKDELFANYKVVKSWDEYIGWFAIKKYNDWYLIESFYTETNGLWFGSIIIEELKKSNSKIYAFSKKDNFYWFNKLDKKSETWACLFVYENKNWNFIEKI